MRQVFNKFHAYCLQIYHGAESAKLFSSPGRKPGVKSFPYSSPEGAEQRSPNTISISSSIPSGLDCCILLNHGLSPVATIGEDVYGKLQVKDIAGIIKKYKEKEKEQYHA